MQRVIPVPRIIGQETLFVDIPSCVREGTQFLVFLPTEMEIFNRHRRLFQLTCNDLLLQGWHIHLHDVLLEYENCSKFRNAVCAEAIVTVIVRFFRADQLIVQILITSD